MRQEGVVITMRFGVIAPHHRAQASLAAGADYIEPHVVNNLVVEADGQWVPNPDFTESGDAPSFAVLFPSSFRLADPAVDLVPVRSYLELAFARWQGWPSRRRRWCWAAGRHGPYRRMWSATWR